MNIIFYAHGEKWRKGNEDKKMTYLDRFFHLTERNTSVRTEIIAGLTTFLSCVSIVVLNPSILSAAGMVYVHYSGQQRFPVRLPASGSVCGGNFPFALGPAMGLNSFFAFSVVLGLGVSWQNALACVFTSGCIFMLLSVFRVQQKIVDAVPDCVKKSIGAGVGLFIAFSGFQSAGIVAKSDSTLVTIVSWVHQVRYCTDRPGCDFNIGHPGG